MFALIEMYLSSFAHANALAYACAGPSGVAVVDKRIGCLQHRWLVRPKQPRITKVSRKVRNESPQLTHIHIAIKSMAFVCVVFSIPMTLPPLSQMLVHGSDQLLTTMADSEATLWDISIAGSSSSSPYAREDNRCRSYSPTNAVGTVPWLNQARTKPRRLCTVLGVPREPRSVHFAPFGNSP